MTRSDWVVVRPSRTQARRDLTRLHLTRADRREVRNLVVLMGRPVSFQARSRRQARRHTRRKATS